MKTIAFAVCLIFFAVEGYAQSGKEYNIDTGGLFYDSSNILKDATGKPITGLVKEYYASGKTKMEDKMGVAI
jgi:hypothetical protein